MSGDPSEIPGDLSRFLRVSSYHLGMAESGKSQAESDHVLALDLEKSRRFLNLLAEDPFVAVVVTDGEVRVFSKDIEPDHLARIKSVLSDLSREE